MNFDQATFAAQLPKKLQALLNRDDALASERASEGLPRRTFLKLTAAGGFALGAFPLGTLAQEAAKPAGLKPTQQPSAFVQIDKDGTTTVTINRLDFGQGVQTALPMILAEELDADWSKVRSRHGNNDAAYVDLVYDGRRPESFLATPGAKDVGVEMWSMSKTYGMAGWRIGFIRGNAEIVERINLLNDHNRVGIFEPLRVCFLPAVVVCNRLAVTQHERVGCHRAHMFRISRL